MDFTGYFNRDGGYSDAYGSGSLAPQFYWDKEVDPEATRAAGYEQYKTVAKVKIYSDNGRTCLNDTVWEDHELPHPTRDWKRIYSHEWEAFKKGKPEEVRGIPLGDFFATNPAKAEHYKLAHIYTVEQLAATSDGNLQTLGIGALSDREAAKKYIESRKEGAVFAALAKEKEALESKIQEGERIAMTQAAQISELTEQLKALTKMLAEDKEVKSAKRK